MEENASDLLLIMPNYEAMIKGGTLKVTEMGVEDLVQDLAILALIDSEDKLNDNVKEKSKSDAKVEESNNDKTNWRTTVTEVKNCYS